MNKSAMIRVRVNPDLKKQVEAIFETLCLNATEAITLFYKQVQLNQGIPFDLKIPNKTTRRSKHNITKKKTNC